MARNSRNATHAITEAGDRAIARRLHAEETASKRRCRLHVAEAVLRRRSPPP